MAALEAAKRMGIQRKNPLFPTIELDSRSQRRHSEGTATMKMTTVERETAQQLLASGWSVAKIARALIRARGRSRVGTVKAHGRKEKR
jgi:DNA-binding NarL/FixJ family response regulator